MCARERRVIKSSDRGNIEKKKKKLLVAAINSRTDKLSAFIMIIPQLWIWKKNYCILPAAAGGRVNVIFLFFFYHLRFSSVRLRNETILSTGIIIDNYTVLELIVDMPTTTFSFISPF